MRGQKVLFVGGQGPVSAPALRELVPDNDVWVMARFSDPSARSKLEATGVRCLQQDMFEDLDGIPTDFDYMFHSAVPMTRDASGMARTDIPARGPWPDSYDKYADATGRILAHCHPRKGFVFTSTISVYDPPGDATPVPETHPFGVHTNAAYAFTKVANEAVISHLARSLQVPATILRVGSASGIDGGPMKGRLDLIVQGRPIPIHSDRPTYVRPIFEPDCARLGVLALEAGRVPPLVVNWCGDEIVSVEDYCRYFGELIGREPVFAHSDDAWGSLVPDTTLMHEVLGPCEVGWRDGCRMLVERCYPELLR